MAKTMKTERKLNNLLSAAGIFLVVLSIMLMSVLSVPAAETSGSLTLRCVFSVEDGERVLPNDEYSLAKIADASITDSSVTYTTREDFTSYDCDWQTMAASKMNEKAKALAYYCEKNSCFTASAVTDQNGELQFENLSVGLYLVARTKTDAANADFITDPLLFFVPQSVNDETVYDIVATPKFSYSSPGKSNTPGTPKSPSDGTLPQTGQLLWPITVLAVLGCLLILGGSALLRKEGSGEKKAR
ncbi:MAG: hypothetical protein IJJ15_03475 [Ruminococcus sp.]|nr:hypothetical protein [Ruminococcus sp.]